LERAPHPDDPSEGRRHAGGQSLVEFTLVIPILVILFVGIADFGRVFNAGVVVEGATRDAAEHGAQAYLANPPGNPSDPPATRLATSAPTPTDSTFYDAIHLQSARVACAETRGLPNADYDTSTGNCPTWPAVGVCVHDGQDPTCGAVPSGFGAYPSGCTDLNGAWTNVPPVAGERAVEVRVCYEFTSLLRLPLFHLGDVYIQRTRVFTIPCYFATGFGQCQ
jgi:TadE-like protein